MKAIPGFTGAPHRAFDVVFWVFLLALILAVYHRAVFVYFLSDDFSSIGKFLEWKRPYAAFSGFFRPIPLASLWLDTQWYGLTPHLFRLESLVLHAINAFLVYRFAGALLAAKKCPKGWEASLISGIFFAVMACHSEAVIWISCRADLLATLFSLGCLTCYLKWLAHPEKKQLVAYTLFLAGALASKESAFALPILLVVITGYCTEHSSLMDSIRKLRGIFLISMCVLLALFVVRHMASGAWLGSEEIVVTPRQYLGNLVNYSFRTLLFPMPFAEVHGKAASVPLFVVTIALGGMLWVAREEPSRSTAILLLVLFIGALSPVLHKALSIDTLQMERYVYLPSVFLCVLMAVVTVQIKNILWRYGVAGAYVCLMVVFLNISIQKWREAGEVSRKSLDEIRTHFAGDKMFVLGLPSSYQGIDVFRNGFPRAVIFFGQVDIKRKFIYMPVAADIYHKNTVLELMPEPDGFRVAVKSGEADLTVGEDLAVYDVVKMQKGGVGVHYPEIGKKDYQVYIYCGDQLMLYERCKL